jgi:hypothetical protein
VHLGNQHHKTSSHEENYNQKEQAKDHGHRTALFLTVVIRGHDLNIDSIRVFLKLFHFCLTLKLLLVSCIFLEIAFGVVLLLRMRQVSGRLYSIFIHIG